MPTDLVTEGVLHATVVSGAVWFSRAPEAPRRYSRAVAAFCASPYCRTIRELRIVALAANAELIASALPAARAAGYSVLLTSPTTLPTRASRNDPRKTLMRSAETTAAERRLPPSTGGWHVMTDDERWIYAALSRLTAGADASEAIELLSNHPLWRRLQFLSPRHDESMATLVAQIRDPRWFVNPAAPDKTRRLYNFMGFNARCTEDAGRQRRRLAKTAWQGCGTPAAGTARDPRGVLWRHYLKLRVEISAEDAERRTSLLFLRFLRGAWLGVIADAAGTRGDGLFVPSYFFDDALAADGVKDGFADDVARAYVDFLAASAPGGAA